MTYLRIGLTALSVLTLASTANAKSYRCSSDQPPAFATEFNLSTRKAAVLDRVTWSPALIVSSFISRGVPSELVYYFEAGNGLKIEFNVTRVTTVLREVDGAVVNSAACERVSENSLLSGI